ncbi:hypothetical protein CCR75_009286 [Bremia lactucae]|uniref:glucan endo-1,3-beta-D-glucosidase n=1 Tax=Bremia lactucae TaxID=4779 RepID=A0A976FHQ7_BRELC|nr:hypothetical protein CCR75_009286 [Bremia lactucae]
MMLIFSYTIFNVKASGPCQQCLVGPPPQHWLLQSQLTSGGPLQKKPVAATSFVPFPMIWRVLAAVAVTLTTVDAALQSAGICYSAWHHPFVTPENVHNDLIIVGKYFSSIRTFQTLFSSVNIITAAAKANIQVAVGVQLTDPALIDVEIQAVCDGYKANPGTVEAVYVGNENLKSKDFGTWTADQLVGFIMRVKACVGSTPVGSVQRINEWLGAETAHVLYKASDILGVNVHPFFSNGPQTAVEKLQLQWDQMAAKYDSKKMHVTETGWPSSGEPYEENSPSIEGMQKFLNDFVNWSFDHPKTYWFMMYDTTVSYTGAEYEKHFGVFTADGVSKAISIPVGRNMGGTVVDNSMKSSTLVNPPTIVQEVEMQEVETQEAGVGAGTVIPYPGACSRVVSSGDAAVGINIVTDASCASGGIGCIDQVCRYCKQVVTPQSTTFLDCVSITGN